MAVFSAVRTMAEHWWVVLLRGILAILFGVLAYTWPGLTVVILVTIWGAYALSTASSESSPESGASGARSSSSACSASRPASWRSSGPA